MNGDITVDIEYLIRHEDDKDREANSITFSSFKNLYDIFFKDEIIAILHKFIQAKRRERDAYFTTALFRYQNLTKTLQEKNIPQYPS